LFVAGRSLAQPELARGDRHAWGGPPGQQFVFLDVPQPPSEVVVGRDDDRHTPGRDARYRLSFEIEKSIFERDVVPGEFEREILERVRHSGAGGRWGVPRDGRGQSAHRLVATRALREHRNRKLELAVLISRSGGGLRVEDLRLLAKGVLQERDLDPGDRLSVRVHDSAGRYDRD